MTSVSELFKFEPTSPPVFCRVGEAAYTIRAMLDKESRKGGARTTTKMKLRHDRARMIIHSFPIETLTDSILHKMY